MPFDGLTLFSVLNECRNKLIGLKIQRVYQPTKEDIILYFSDYDKTALGISASASCQRICITNTKYDNPETPPAFCMVLRKYLVGGIIKDIIQKDFDRIAIFDIESLDEAGNLIELELVVELMGKHSNITLLEKNTQKILDAIKHISGLKSSVRKIMPNFDFIYPPCNKLNPLDFDEQTALGMLSFELGKTISAGLCNTFNGISKALSQSFVFDEYKEDKLLSELSLDDMSEMIKSFGDYILLKTKKPDCRIYYNADGSLKDYSSVYYSALGNYVNEKSASVCEAIDSFYKDRTLTGGIKQRYEDIIKHINTIYEREEKKLKARNEDLSKAQGCEIYNVYGNLLLSNLHLIKKGDDKVDVINFYSENGENITIELKKEYTPSKNAQMYFKKYNKAKNAIKHLEQLIAESTSNVKFLAEQLFYLENAESISEAEEILAEIEKAGFIKRNKKKTGIKKQEKTDFFRYESRDGYEILAGKNSVQNNALTFKLASKDDIWLHAKDVPASHVILRTNKGAYSETSLENAAEIAVYHSKLRESTKVAVDYTYVKNVKKIVSSSYGNVTFTDNKCVYITVDQRKIKELEK